MDLEYVFDTITLFITFVSLSVTVFYSYKTQNYAKKKFTLEALNSFSTSIREIFDDARNIFSDDEYTETIDLNIIKVKLETPENARKIRNLLNEYERLTRGVTDDVYDIEMVKNSRKSNIVMVYLRYHELIKLRRSEGKNSWKNLESVAEMWIKESN